MDSIAADPALGSSSPPRIFTSPNCTAMLEATITRVPETKKLAAASLDRSNYEDAL